MVKNLPAMQETWVQPLGWEDPLVAHSNVLAWTIPWTEEPGRLTESTGLQRVGCDSATNTSLFNHIRKIPWQVPFLLLMRQYSIIPH